MDRRCFFSSSACFSLIGPAITFSQTFGGDKKGTAYDADPNGPELKRIGDRSLVELLEFHERELEGEYLKVWNNRGIDHEFGGLIRRWNENGAFTSDVKNLYDLGRGLWVFSHLYNHFGGREKHLTGARLCWEFIRDHCHDEESGYWFAKVSRDGKTVVEGPYDIYGDMYIILGLSEYYMAVNDPALLDIAVETMHGITRRIVAAEYQHIKAHKDGFDPGTKILGTWQHFLNALTCLAREKDDRGVEKTIRMCVRNIMERHWQPELGVFMEYLDDTFMPFQPGGDPGLRKVSSWHSVQSAWMCMDEALRRGDRRTFTEAVEMGQLTLERCWLSGENGGLIGLDFPEQDVSKSSDKPAWGRLDDTLVFLLLTIEHTQAAWAVTWYDRILTHAYKKPEKFNRKGLLHHPRRLFFSIHILKRMIARNGKPSAFFTA